MINKLECVQACCRRWIESERREKADTFDIVYNVCIVSRWMADELFTGMSEVV